MVVLFAPFQIAYSSHDFNLSGDKGRLAAIVHADCIRRLILNCNPTEIYKQFRVLRSTLRLGGYRLLECDTK